MSSKSPAFQWYAADYLADERVAQLPLDSEAVYVRLLSYCWREGSIPANAAACAPMCKYADVKVIKPALALFMKSPAQPGRLIHKRLEEERAKQEAFRARQAEKGAKGGRPRKPDEKPEKPAALPGLSSGLAGVKPDESFSISSSTSTSSKDDEREAGEQSSEDLDAHLTASSGGGTVGGPARAVLADDAPVFTITAFREYIKGVGFGAVDIGYYLPQIQAEARKKPARPNSGDGLTWEGFVNNYLKNDRLHNRLVYPLPAEGQQGAYQQQQRITGNPTSAVAAGDLQARAEAQKTKTYL